MNDSTAQQPTALRRPSRWLLRSATLLGLALAGWAAAAGDDLRLPLIEPPPTLPMSVAYQVLLTRSIFSRDHNRAMAVVRSAVPSTQPLAAAQTTSTAPDAEANFVLKGMAVEDGAYTAFFEQAPQDQLIRVHVGEPISHGHLIRITLDGVDYIASGQKTRVLIGQALDGGSSLLATTRPSTDVPRNDPPSVFGAKPSWWRRTH